MIITFAFGFLLGVLDLVNRFVVPYINMVYAWIVLPCCVVLRPSSCVNFTDFGFAVTGEVLST